MKNARFYSEAKNFFHHWFRICCRGWALFRGDECSCLYEDRFLGEVLKKKSSSMLWGQISKLGSGYFVFISGMKTVSRVESLIYCLHQLHEDSFISEICELWSSFAAWRQVLRRSPWYIVFINGMKTVFQATVRFYCLHRWYEDRFCDGVLGFLSSSSIWRLYPKI